MEIQRGQEFQTIVSKLYQCHIILMEIQEVVSKLYEFRITLHGNSGKSKIFKFLYPNGINFYILFLVQSHIFT